jgi:hypothetical protein
MRGSPLVRALVLFLGLLALSWPLRLFLQREAAQVAVAQSPAVVPEPAAASRLPLTLTFSQKALRAEVRYAGKSLWLLEHPGLRETGELRIPFPKEGVELLVSVEFEGEAQGALRLQLTAPDGNEYDRSLWGAGTVEAVIPFP